MRSCKLCGRLFRPTHSRQAYCTREHSKVAARLTKTQRYSTTHRADRRRWEPIVAGGRVMCARCGEPIRYGESWHLDHLDDRTSRPSHASCNTRAGNRSGALPLLGPKRLPFQPRQPLVAVSFE